MQGGAFGVGIGQRGGGCLALFAFGQLVEDRQIFQPLPQLLDPAQFALGMRELAGDLLGVVLVVPQIGVGRLVLEFIDAAA